MHSSVHRAQRKEILGHLDCACPSMIHRPVPVRGLGVGEHIVKKERRSRRWRRDYFLFLVFITSKPRLKEERHRICPQMVCGMRPFRQNTWTYTYITWSAAQLNQPLCPRQTEESRLCGADATRRTSLVIPMSPVLVFMGGNPLRAAHSAPTDFTMAAASVICSCNSDYSHFSSLLL